MRSSFSRSSASKLSYTKNQQRTYELSFFLLQILETATKDELDAEEILKIAQDNEYLNAFTQDYISQITPLVNKILKEEFHKPKLQQDYATLAVLLSEEIFLNNSTTSNNNTGTAFAPVLQVQDLLSNPFSQKDEEFPAIPNFVISQLLYVYDLIVHTRDVDQKHELRMKFNKLKNLTIRNNDPSLPIEDRIVDGYSKLFEKRRWIWKDNAMLYAIEPKEKLLGEELFKLMDAKSNLIEYSRIDFDDQSDDKLPLSLFCVVKHKLQKLSAAESEKQSQQQNGVTTDNEAAKKLKDEGNQFFGKRDFASAIEIYSKALQMQLDDIPLIVNLLSNRAQAYKEQKQYQEMLYDSSLAYRLDPKDLKTIYRYAFACLHRHEYEKCRELCVQGLEMQKHPSFWELLKELAKKEHEEINNIEEIFGPTPRLSEEAKKALISQDTFSYNKIISIDDVKAILAKGSFSTLDLETTMPKIMYDFNHIEGHEQLVKSFPALPSVKILKLPAGATQQFVAQILKKTPNVETLISKDAENTFDSNYLPSKPFTQLVPKLKSIQLESNDNAFEGTKGIPVNDQAITKFTQQFPQLTSLVFGPSIALGSEDEPDGKGCSHLSGECLPSIFKNCSNLQTLCLGSVFEDKQLKEYFADYERPNPKIDSKLKITIQNDAKNLKNLKLELNISDEAARAVFLHVPQLERLEVHNHLLTDASVETLVQTCGKTLQYCKIVKNWQLTEQSLASLGKCDALHSLEIKGSSTKLLTLQGLQALVKSGTVFERLHLHECHNIDPEIFKTLVMHTKSLAFSECEFKPEVFKEEYLKELFLNTSLPLQKLRVYMDIFDFSGNSPNGKYDRSAEYFGIRAIRNFAPQITVQADTLDRYNKEIIEDQRVQLVQQFLLKELISKRTGTSTNSAEELLKHNSTGITWKNVEVAQPPKINRLRDEHVYYNGSVYIFGGRDPSFELHDSLWAFDLQSRAWKEVQASQNGSKSKNESDGSDEEEAPKEKQYHGVSFGPLKSKLAPPPPTAAPKSSPSKRDGHALCVYQDTLLLFGGMGEFVTSNPLPSRQIGQSKQLPTLTPSLFNDVYQFNFKTNEWKLCKTKQNQFRPPQLYNSSLIVLQDRAYVVGGVQMFNKIDENSSLKSTTELSLDIYCLHLKKWKWSLETTVPIQSLLPKKPASSAPSKPLRKKPTFEDVDDDEFDDEDDEDEMFANKFKPSQEKEEQPTPHIGCCSVGDSLYVYAMDHLYQYSTATKTWTKLYSAPAGSNLFEAASEEETEENDLRKLIADIQGISLESDNSNSTKQQQVFRHRLIYNQEKLPNHIVIIHERMHFRHRVSIFDLQTKTMQHNVRITGRITPQDPNLNQLLQTMNEELSAASKSSSTEQFTSSTTTTSASSAGAPTSSSSSSSVNEKEETKQMTEDDEDFDYEEEIVVNKGSGITCLMLEKDLLKHSSEQSTIPVALEYLLYTGNEQERVKRKSSSFFDDDEDEDDDYFDEDDEDMPPMLNTNNRLSSLMTPGRPLSFSRPAKALNFGKDSNAKI